MKRSSILGHYAREMNGMAQWTMAASEDLKDGRIHLREQQIAFQRAIMQAVQLPRRYWEVLVLCDVQGNHPSAAAEMLGISPDLAIKRLLRARRFLSSFQTPGNA